MTNNLDSVHLMFDPLGIGFFILNANFEVVYTNNALKYILDRDTDIINTPFLHILSVAKLNDKDLFTEKLLNDPVIVDFELKIVTSLGDFKYISIDVCKNNGEITGIIRDITKKAKITKKLNKELTLYNSFMDHVPGTIYFKDKESRFILVNKAKADEHGLTKADLIGKSDFDFYSQQEASTKYNDEQQLMENNSVMNKEEVIDFAHVKRWIWTSKAPHYDENNKVAGTFGISWDISELKKTQEKLEEAIEKAESANKAKGMFLATMSHELRTPMNGIIGISEMLLKYHNQNLTEKQTEWVKIILESGNTLLDLINDILDLTKLEADKMPVTLALFSQELLYFNIRALVSTQLKNKGLNFIIRKSEHIPDRIISDEKKIRQILLNLIGNAIKFADKGKITLRIHTINDRLYFEVIDEGIGISKENIPHIFDEFMQAESSFTKKEGTGLGLAICKKLVHLLKGEIEIESELNVGTIVRFYIPYKSEIEITKKEETISNLMPDITDAVSRKILLAENDKLTVHIFKEYLKSKNFQLLVAEDGKSALESSFKNHPDLIILDIGLPELSGIEVLERLRAKDEFADIPVILCSISDADIIIGYIDANTCYMQKPIKEEDLTYNINKLFRLKSKLNYQIIILDPYNDLLSLEKALNEIKVPTLSINNSSLFLNEIDYYKPPIIIVNKAPYDNINILDIDSFIRRNHNVDISNCHLIIYSDRDYYASIFNHVNHEKVLFYNKNQELNIKSFLNVINDIISPLKLSNAQI